MEYKEQGFTLKSYFGSYMGGIIDVFSMVLENTFLKKNFDKFGELLYKEILNG